MAKDGTNRGGARIGAGRKRKALSERLLEGIEKPQTLFEKTQASFEFPQPKSYLSTLQRDGKPTEAAEIYRETYSWLAKRGCADTISRQLVEDYAQATARFIQAEGEISRAGFLVRNPVINEVLPSPLVKISLDYLKAANQLWYQIDRYARENSAGNSGGTTDTMELILRRTLKGGE